MRDHVNSRIAGSLIMAGTFSAQKLQNYAQLATYVDIEHCIAVASGTDALLIALMALGIKAGDR